MKMARNAEKDCLNALFQLHKDQCDRNAINYELTGSDPLSGPHIAARFARQAAINLSHDQLEQLLSFLKTLSLDRIKGEEGLKNLLDTRLERFYSSEVQLSRQDPKRLTRPGGPEDAKLGIIMHLQTKKKAVTEFWDEENSTIALLEEKGLTGHFAFGYDWHWRAEDSFKNRTSCPATKWEKPLRNLHDDLSTDLLDLLPLPFLVTASGCTRKNLRKTLTANAASFDLIVDSLADKLPVDLDFREGKLRRIVLHVHHPISGVYNDTDRRSAMAAQLDGGLNFLLRLTGRTYHVASLRQAYARACGGRSEHAPLAELWSYVKKELSEGRILELDEYMPSFLAWARRYLNEDPTRILSQGVSLADQAAAKLRSALSATAFSREEEKRILEREKRLELLSSHCLRGGSPEWCHDEVNAKRTKTGHSDEIVEAMSTDSHTYSTTLQPFLPWLTGHGISPLSTKECGTSLTTDNKTSFRSVTLATSPHLEATNVESASIAEGAIVSFSDPIGIVVDSRRGQLGRKVLRLSQSEEPKQQCPKKSVFGSGHDQATMRHDVLPKDNVVFHIRPNIGNHQTLVRQ